MDVDDESNPGNAAIFGSCSCKLHRISSSVCIVQDDYWAHVLRFLEDARGSAGARADDNGTEKNKWNIDIRWSCLPTACTAKDLRSQDTARAMQGYWGFSAALVFLQQSNPTELYQVIAARRIRQNNIIFIWFGMGICSSSFFMELNNSNGPLLRPT